MQHRYNKIRGWFNFPDIYSEMIEKVDEGHFVEIGTFFGKSASYMGVEILNAGKQIIFDTIDTFQGSPQELDGKHAVYKTTDIQQRAEINLKDLPVNVRVFDSVSAAKLYQNKSLDFVFIDGAHDYASVLADIKSWHPKVKPGGYIGGHDYDNRNVKRAVDEYFNEYCGKSVNSWLIKV
jgi:predicted O-methyltransferase YrrM